MQASLLLALFFILWLLSVHFLLKLPNKIVILNFFVKDICYDLIPFGSDCPYPMDCMK